MSQYFEIMTKCIYAFEGQKTESDTIIREGAIIETKMISLTTASCIVWLRKRTVMRLNVVGSLVCWTTWNILETDTWLKHATTSTTSWITAGKKQDWVSLLCLLCILVEPVRVTTKCHFYP